MTEEEQLCSSEEYRSDNQTNQKHLYLGKVETAGHSGDGDATAVPVGSDKDTNTNIDHEEKSERQRDKPPKPEVIDPCPRCNSRDTKFCYYNNYNVRQPRFLCKSCQRYWTGGGTLRNVPPGSGRRKSKASSMKDVDKSPIAEHVVKHSNFPLPPATSPPMNTATLYATGALSNPLLNDPLLAYNAAAAAALAQQQILASSALPGLKGFGPGQWPVASPQLNPDINTVLLNQLQQQQQQAIGYSNALGAPYHPSLSLDQLQQQQAAGPAAQTVAPATSTSTAGAGAGAPTHPKVPSSGDSATQSAEDSDRSGHNLHRQSRRVRSKAEPSHPHEVERTDLVEGENEHTIAQSSGRMTSSAGSLISASAAEPKLIANGAAAAAAAAAAQSLSDQINRQQAMQAAWLQQVASSSGAWPLGMLGGAAGPLGAASAASAIDMLQQQQAAAALAAISAQHTNLQLQAQLQAACGGNPHLINPYLFPPPQPAWPYAAGMHSSGAANGLLAHQSALTNQNAAAAAAAAASAALLSQQLLGARSGQHQGLPNMASTGTGLPPGIASGLPGSWQMMGGGGGMPWAPTDLMNLPLSSSFPTAAALDPKSVGWPSTAAPFLAQHLQQYGLISQQQHNGGNMMSQQQAGDMSVLSQQAGSGRQANSEAPGRGGDDGVDSQQAATAGLGKHSRMAAESHQS